MAKRPEQATRNKLRSEERDSLLSSIGRNGYLVTLLVIIVFGIFVLAPQVQMLYQQRQQISDVQAQVDAAKAAALKMQTERVRWEDPVYVRAQARNRLYYVMPGEVSYLVMDANGVNQSDVTGTVGSAIAARTHSAEVSKDIHTTRNNWMNNLLESVIRSGTDEPTAKKLSN